MSGLVPAAKVSVVVAVPESSALDEHVDQVIEPAHLLLDHLHDGVLDRLRRGAGIGRGDLDRRRRDRRILLDRHREDRQGAREHHQDAR